MLNSLNKKTVVVVLGVVEKWGKREKQVWVLGKISEDKGVEK